MQRSQERIVLADVGGLIQPGCPTDWTGSAVISPDGRVLKPHTLLQRLT